MDTKTFLETNSREKELREQFPQFDTLPLEDRIEIRELWSIAGKMWAHKRLVQVYGVACDSDNDGCNPQQMGPMRGEEGYGKYAGDN